jgi:hypothetical protein
MFDLVSLPVVSLLPTDGSLTPADFQHVSYSPTFLLPARFDASVVADPEYQQALEVGFRCFPPDDECRTIEEVENFLEDELDAGFRLGMSLPWTIGLLHGWLSALALTDRSLALAGLELLPVLVAQMI